jgi:hypothetical protein
MHPIVQKNNSAEIVRGKDFVVEEEEGDLDHAYSEGIHGLYQPAHLHSGLVLKVKWENESNTRKNNSGFLA